MLAISEPCRETRQQVTTEWMEGNDGQWSHSRVNMRSSKTYWSEDHVQWHGDVEVESVVIDNADGEEHGHHDHIVTEEKRDINNIII